MFIQSLVYKSKPQKFESTFFKFLGSLMLIILILSQSVMANNDEKAKGQNQNSNTTVGELLLNTSNGSPVNALLLDTNINADVNGLIATVTIEQRFRNNSDDWVNGRYVFPLPENSSVDGLTLKIGDRLIKGVIKEKSDAKKLFKQAKKAGKKASLLEQHRPNLFSISVANIPPQSEIITTISILDRVKYDNQEFSLRLPTTITPRYIPGKVVQLDIEENKEIQIDANSGWGMNTDIVVDATEITQPQFYTSDNGENDISESRNNFTFDMTLNAGMKLSRIYSNTHKLSIRESIQANSKNVSSLSLLNDKDKMDRDLVIHWLPVKSSAPTAALFQQTVNGEFYSMALLLPPTTKVQNSLARETTFIIDSSGSMAGSSMEQAKNSILIALDKLTAQDRFNVIDFDSSFSPLFKQPQQANFINITRARSMIHSLSADGGTEMYQPLDFALSSPVDENYLKQVIFITDGSVGNEQQLFELIHSKLGNARLFTVGIGSAPNSHFMNKAAQFGRGSFTYIDSITESVKKMSELFNKINKPLARDLKVNYPGMSTQVEQYPNDIPDLYAGEPLVIFTKSSTPISKIQINGNLLGNKWSHNLTSNSESTQTANTSNIDALWARKKIASLMDNLFTGFETEQEIKPRIIELGLKHHLVTKFTSFIAIEEKVSKPDELNAKNKNVANLMPKGSKMTAPQTATPATLYGLLGSLLLILAMSLGALRVWFSNIAANNQ